MIQPRSSTAELGSSGVEELLSAQRDAEIKSSLELRPPWDGEQVQGDEAVVDVGG